jgi:hypothetical protein
MLQAEVTAIILYALISLFPVEACFCSHDVKNDGRFLNVRLNLLSSGRNN